MKLFFYLLLVNVLAITPSYAQSLDFGLMAGASNYSGDLTENVVNVMKQSKFCTGAQVRYDFSNMISLKCQYLFLNVAADDQLAKAQWQKERNLNFKSQIHELGILGQLNLMGFFSEIPKRHNYYLTMGAIFFKFNPKGKYLNEWLELQPIGTEGQGLPGYNAPYKLNSAALAFGFGYRFFISSNISLSAEYLTRQTRTDYLDDASTNYVAYDELLAKKGLIAAELGNKVRFAGGLKRAEFNNKDWYNSLSLCLSYHFGADISFKKIRFKKQGINCPKF